MLGGLELLNAVRRAYQACTAYSDEGSSHVKGQELGRFTTTYRRSDGFIAFRFRTSAAFGSSRDDVYAYTGFDNLLSTFEAPAVKVMPSGRAVRDPTSVRGAVGQLAGVTFGTSSMIPGLLVPPLAGAEIWLPRVPATAIVSERDGVARMEFGSSFLDIELTTLTILRQSSGGGDLTVYRPQITYE